MNRGISIRLVLLLLGIAVASVFLFRLCYQYDNKYTAPGKQPVSGVLTLSEEDLKAHPMTFLIRDWEIYRGRLLSPDDFAGNPPSPDELTFIGQYGGFEGKDKAASPHGSATYRLRMVLPSEKHSYTLELPEIYSAYKLYINGVLEKQMGEPAPEGYRAQTGNSTVTIQAAGGLEILVAVSDHSYFYSGMVYPPAFGVPDTVASYLSWRYGLRMACMAAALCVALLSLCIHGMIKQRKEPETENNLTLLYSLLCLCFVGYTCYPVVKTLYTGGMLWYHVENFCYSAIFLLVGLIQHRISGFGGKAASAFVLFGVFVCYCSVLVPFFLADNLTLLLSYSLLLQIYTWVSALFLTVSTAYGFCHGAIYSPIMLSGMIVFDCALIMDRIYPNHEPVLIGWFSEIAGGVLVILIGVVMADHIAQQYCARLILEEQVNHSARVLEMQSAYYPVLLEKEQEAKAARHDLRHHFLIFRELAAQGEMGALTKYLDEYGAAYLTPGGTSYCKHYVVDMLLRIYTQKADEYQVRLTTNIRTPEHIGVGNVDLCVIISNLMENALEACQPLPPELRWVHIGIVYQMSRLSIVIDNSSDSARYALDGKILSRKRVNSPGVGLMSVQTVAKKYQGNFRFYPERDGRAFHSEVLLVAVRSEALVTDEPNK